MHRCIHPSFTYSFIFLFNVCCRNSISSTLTFDDATSKIRFSSIKTILSRSFCADSFICLVVFVCKKAHHTHTQHQSITTSQHHTRYYIHTNCHSAAKTVVIITDRLVFFFLLFGCRQRHLYLPEKRGRRYVLPWSITNRHCFPTTTRTFYAAGCFFFFLFLFCSIYAFILTWALRQAKLYHYGHIVSSHFCRAAECSFAIFGCCFIFICSRERWQNAWDVFSRK